MKLNLGCGERYMEGWVNCDLLPSLRVDQVFDLNQCPYPFEDDSVDEILMDNVLEHLDDIPNVMRELHRILKPGARARILVPYAKSDWALQDPTHTHFFTEVSLSYFCEGNPYNYYTDIRFHQVQARLYTDALTWRHKLRNLIPFRSVLRYFFFNLYDGIDFILEKPKGGDTGAETTHRS